MEYIQQVLMKEECNHDFPCFGFYSCNIIGYGLQICLFLYVYAISYYVKILLGSIFNQTLTVIARSVS